MQKSSLGRAMSSVAVHPMQNAKHRNQKPEIKIRNQNLKIATLNKTKPGKKLQYPGRYVRGQAPQLRVPVGLFGGTVISNMLES